jgi:hypothetical protein
LLCLLACLLACTSLVAKNQNKRIWGFFFGHLFGLLLSTDLNWNPELSHL